jgi:neutral ceramidase
MRLLLILSLVALSELACAPHSNNGALEVGLASRDITPPLGYRLAGYYYERLATAVHDPLQAKAIVFKQGDVRFALVICDLCQTSPEVVAQARTLASQKTGIAADHICICSTHTHTGPDYFSVLADHLHEIAIVAHQGVDPARTIDYPNMLAGKIAEAIIEADSSAAPASLGFATAPQPNVAFNRRYFMHDGTVAWNPGKNNPKVVKPAGPIDPDVSVLTIARESSGKPEAILTSFPLHPDTMGGTEFSGDYPHYLQEGLRSELGEPALLSIFAQGTSGNINHINVASAAKQSGAGESERIGHALAGAVAAVVHSPALRHPSLAIVSTRIELPLQQFTPEEVARARADFARIQERKLPFLVGVRATKIMKVIDRHHGQPIPAQVQALRLSDDAAIVMLPSELFVEFGLTIKERSPFKHTMVIELANDSFGYVPTKKAFAEGAYEPTNATIEPGGGERLVEAALELLGRLKS